MPTVNIYSADEGLNDSLTAMLSELRGLIARELTCGEKRLMPHEVSLRLIPVTGSLTISPIEIEIFAHAYRARIEQANNICLLVREFVKEQLPLVADVRVWLVLAELGHSWED
jgi:hypothetical protein